MHITTALTCQTISQAATRRYRDRCQVFFSCLYPLHAQVRDKGPTVFGDAIHREQELVQGGDQGDLREFAPGAQPIVVGPQPRVRPHRDQGRHPEGRPQPSIPGGRQAGVREPQLAGLPGPRDNADVGGQGGGAPEGRRAAVCTPMPVIVVSSVPTSCAFSVRLTSSSSASIRRRSSSRSSHRYRTWSW